MAIIVEEEKNRSNLTSMLGWFVILAIVLFAVYDIFFTSPEPSIIIPPAGFEQITPIAQISADPTNVVNSPNFQALKQYVPEPVPTGPTAVGRTNPFLSP